MNGVEYWNTTIKIINKTKKKANNKKHTVITNDTPTSIERNKDKEYSKKKKKLE